MFMFMQEILRFKFKNSFAGGIFLCFLIINIKNRILCGNVASNSLLHFRF